MIVKHPRPHALLNAAVKAHFRERPVSVFEAGGGSRTYLDLDNLQVSSMTTADINEDQLRRNAYADHKLLVDLQDFTPEKTYDLIIFYNVLEHVERADRALDNLSKACAENGLIVIGSPDMYSFTGMVTRFSPHWFHVFYYRYILKNENAGKDGHVPFPTFFHPLTDPRKLPRFFADRGFEMEYLSQYSSRDFNLIARNRPLIGYPLKGLVALINALTPKAYNARNGEYHAIFRRRAEIGIAAAE